MKTSKNLFIGLIVIIIGVSGVYLYNKIINEKKIIVQDIEKEDIQLKEEAIKKFYSSYEEKSIEIYNDSVIDSLKAKTEEDKELRRALYEDIISFKLIDFKENKVNPVQELNGIKYDKDNIAEFTAYYEVDYDKNIYGSAGEGKQSVKKVIVRENKNSPWLVAGQIDGQGY
ncbi:DUF4829 domain-containing protein [Clostridium intestinale]|uniref:DUF4829 domain-containing protein n=1 Tax=Clostridium intestinale TaxID=36845 RepID=UPI0028ED5D30|nr:DUF4829 domain-containing protein [Clostridium intestinale]